MRLVDTSAWIEWLSGSPTGEAVAQHIPEQADWLTATMVQLELAKWLVRELGEDRADPVIAFSQRCVVAPLDTETALLAAELCPQHHLATADAVVYATAVRHDAALLTCDAHFKDLPGVIYVQKISASPHTEKKTP